MIVVACPDQCEGTDSEALGLAFHHQGPTFIKVYCQAATKLIDQDRGGVIMLCLDQGSMGCPCALSIFTSRPFSKFFFSSSFLCFLFIFQNGGRY